VSADEAADIANPLASAAKRPGRERRNRRLVVPKADSAEEERAILLRQPLLLRLSLGQGSCAPTPRRGGARAGAGGARRLDRTPHGGVDCGLNSPLNSLLPVMLGPS